MQSKLFWYECLVKNKINTPKVYYHIINKTIKEINKPESNISKFIIKPNYGTVCIGIKKIDVSEIKNIKQNDIIIQEYITDCFTKYARHFRINTIYVEKNAYIFTIYESISNNKAIASNYLGSVLGNMTTRVCRNNNCEFLSVIEQQYIKDIGDKLINLHNNVFSKIPVIGWDICLTCDGPYVFEGNLGASINEYKYNEYIDTMTNIYK